MHNNLYLINVLSGSKKGVRLLKVLNSAIKDGQIFGRAEPLDLKNLGSQLSAITNYKKLILAGGDGTFSSVLSQLRDSQIPVGFLPLGTGNDLARALNLMTFDESNPVPLIRQLDTAKIKMLQVWTLHDLSSDTSIKYFCNYCSFGFDADVVNRFAELRRNPNYFLYHFGRVGNRIGYAIAGLLPFIRMQKLDLQKNMEKQYIHQTPLSLFFANIKPVMGLGMSNLKSDYSDNLLEGLAIKSFSQYFPFLSGRELFNLKPTFLGAQTHWRLELNNAAAIQLDGEPYPSTTSTAFEIRPSHLVRVLYQ
jgi:diacylglycerol kinase family enzyme